MRGAKARSTQYPCHILLTGGVLDRHPQRDGKYSAISESFLDGSQCEASVLLCPDDCLHAPLEAESGRVRVSEDAWHVAEGVETGLPEARDGLSDGLPVADGDMPVGAGECDGQSRATIRDQ